MKLSARLSGFLGVGIFFFTIYWLRYNPRFAGQMFFYLLFLSAIIGVLLRYAILRKPTFGKYFGYSLLILSIIWSSICFVAVYTNPRSTAFLTKTKEEA